MASFPLPDESDSELLPGETSNGKEQVAKKPAEEVFVRKGHFRLMDLPAELRVYIYSFFLPHNLVISHSKQYKFRSTGFSWGMEARTRNGGSVPLAIGPQQDHTYYNYDVVSSFEQHSRDAVELQLFLVNKFISNEAKAVLYGSNTFEFTVTDNAHYVSSLRSKEIFGPFGDALCLPMMRNMRSIHIQVILHADSHWAIKRQRARLEYFVEVLKEHADDENRKSLLQELIIEVGNAKKKLRSRWNRKPHLPASVDREQFMFGLESLATLRGIRDVKVTGVSQWFAECLQLCIQGKGGKVQEIDWPVVEITRRKGVKSYRRKKVLVSTRKWHQPTLDWREFAERNHVEVPADVDKFWAAVT